MWCSFFNKSHLLYNRDSISRNMKVRRFAIIALLVFGAMGFGSCTDYDEPQNKIDNVEAVVAPYTQVSGTVPSNVLLEGMSVQIGKDKPGFMAFGAIDGFTYEAGHEYSLVLQRTTLANPPADGYGCTYKLIKIKSEKDFAESRNNIDLYVSSEFGEYKWGDLTCDMPSKGIKYKENINDEWTSAPFNKIQGFNYEEGYNYVLSVEKVILPENSPYYNYAILQRIQYKLKNIISKYKV